MAIGDDKFIVANKYLYRQKITTETFSINNAINDGLMTINNGR